jgi:hypothetical protein
MNQLGDIMERLRDKGVDAGTAFALFGQRAGVAATAFTSFYNDLAAFNDVVGDSDGAAKRMADTMDSGLEAATKKLKSAWMEMIQVIGDSSSLLKGLTFIVNAIRKFILDLAFAIQVLNNAAKNGELIALLMAAFKLSATKTGNFYFNALVYAFKGVATIVVGVFSMLASPVFWSGIYQVFLASAYMLGAKVAEIVASLITGSLNFALPLITAVNYVSNILIGGAMVAGGFIYSYIESGVNLFNKGTAYVLSIWDVISMVGMSMINYITQKVSGWIGVFTSLLNFVSTAIVEKLGGVANLFRDVFTWFIGAAGGLIGWVMEQIGTKVDERTEESTGAGADITKAGIDRLGKGWDQISKETADMGAKAAGFAFDLSGKAAEAAAIGSSELGDALGSNILDPMAALKAGFKPSDIFGEGDAFKALQEIVGRNMPKVPEKPPGEDRTRDRGGMGGGVGGMGRSLAGANRMATNLIMGRTINEVIAEIAQKQLDVAEDTLTATQQTNTKLDSLKVTGGAGTFD